MADTLDLLSLPEAKRAVNRDPTNTTDEDLLARHVTALSRIIDDQCGPVVVRTVTDEEHPGRRSVRLRRYPVTSITTVKEAWLGNVDTLSAVAFGATTDGYRALKWERNPSLLSGVLYRHRYGSPCSWRGEVQVTYVAGRYATTAIVDARFKDAASAILRRLWKREAPTWAQSAEALSQLDDGTDQGGSPFFRAVKPMVEELLYDEVQTHLVGFA